MKKRKLLIISGLFILALTVISSCGFNSTTSEMIPSNTSNIGNVSSNDQTFSDYTDSYLNITSLCKLDLEYTNKSFFNHGISKVTIIKCNDGDTTTFGLPNDTKKTSIVLRYMSINAPEATVSPEKWGKAATNYVSNRLENAYEIVVEAVLDSSGNPTYSYYYNGYVWYRNSATDTFKNLNVELVENGYAKYTGTSSDKYNSYFSIAETKAKENQLHIWSNDDDPLYSNVPYKVTIEELVKDLATDNPSYYSIEEDAGAKITFNATILDHTTSGDSHYYTLGSVGSDSKLYSINCFGGYASSPLQGFLVIGNTYNLTAFVSKNNGNYQISGIEYTIGSKSDYNATLFSKNNYYIFDSNHQRINVKKETCLNTDLLVSAATIVNGSLIIIASTTMKETNNVESFTIIVNDISKYNTSSLIGKNISCSGFIKSDNQIVLSNINDITIR